MRECLGQRLDARFGRVINRIAGRTRDALLATRVDDDTCVFLRGHDRSKGGTTIEDAKERGVEVGAPRRGDFAGRCIEGKDGRVGKRCGVVHQNGHLAPRLHDLITNALDVLELADVGSNAHAFAGTRRRLDRRFRVFQQLLVDVHQAHLHALASKMLGGGESDARGTTGDDGDRITVENRFEVCRMEGEGVSVGQAGY